MSALNREVQQLRAQELQVRQEFALRMPSPMPLNSLGRGEGRRAWSKGLLSVLFLVLLAVGFIVLHRLSGLALTERSALAHGTSLALVAYGVYSARRGSLLGHSLLAAGAGALYLAAYAAFFIPGFVVAEVAYAPATLAAVLVANAALAYWLSTQSVAVVSVGAAWLTMAWSMLKPSSAGVVYVLVMSATILVLVVVLHARHRWLTLSWVALAGVYGLFALYLSARPDYLAVSDGAYFIIAFALLTGAFVLLSVAVLLDGRIQMPGRRSLALFALTNAAVYYLQGRMSIEGRWEHAAWMFDVAFTMALGLFACLAYIVAPRRHFLTEAFLAAMVFVAALGLAAALSGAVFWVALAASSLFLAFMFARTGVVFLKVVNLVLLLVTFVVCLWAVNWRDKLALGGYAVGSDWFVGIGVPVVLALAAAVYQNLARIPHTRPGKWFLEGTLLEVRNGNMALLHAAAGALILLTITISQMGDDPALPYLIAAEAVTITSLGYILFTPPLRAAGMALLVAAHVAYYFLLRLNPPSSPTPDLPFVYVGALAGITFLAAYLWERYIKSAYRLPPWQYDAVAVAPYLLATFLLCHVIGERLDWLYGPLGHNLLGLALLALGAVMHYSGIKSAGLMAMAIGTVTVVLILALDPAPGATEESLLGVLGVLAVTYPMGERLLALMQRHERTHIRFEDVARSLLVLLGSAMGVVAMYMGAPRDRVTLGLLILGLVLLAMALVTRETRYGWVSLFVGMLTIVRGIFYDAQSLSTGYRIAGLVALAAIAAVGVIVYWRRRHTFLPSPLHLQKSASSKASDGRTS